MVCAIAPGSPEPLRSVKQLIEAGKLKATIERRFALGQNADAHRYAESRYRRGQIVVTVDELVDNC